MPESNLPSTGPFLGTAVLCEKVLQEADGVISIIRVVDRITHSAIGPEVADEMPPFTINLNALVSLKSGTAKGRFKVKIRPEAPSGELLPAIEVPVLFEGEERGVNLILQIAIQAEHEGLYWFDVFLEEGRLTRIPLRVVYQPQRVGGPTSEPTD
jgi:hypothetical protein